MNMICRSFTSVLLSKLTKTIPIPHAVLSYNECIRKISASSKTTESQQLKQQNENKEELSPSSLLLNISEACIKKLNSLCSTADGSDRISNNNNNKTYLRVIVDGGGCSGFQYKFELDTTVKDDDDVCFGPNNLVVIDKVSLEYCSGSTLDYHSELIKSGFRIIGNPKAEQGCSCGASFSLKI